MLFDRVQFHLCISRSLKDTKDKPHFVHLLLYKKYLLLIDDKISGGGKDYISCSPSGQQQDLVNIENEVSLSESLLLKYQVLLQRFMLMTYIYSVSCSFGQVQSQLQICLFYIGTAVSSIMPEEVRVTEFLVSHAR